MKNKLPFFFTLSLAFASAGLFCMGWWASSLLNFLGLSAILAQNLENSELSLAAIQKGLITLGAILFLLTTLLFLLRSKLKAKSYAILLLVVVLLSLVAASFRAVSP